MFASRSGYLTTGKWKRPSIVAVVSLGAGGLREFHIHCARAPICICE